VTDFADLKTQIAEWANRQDWSDILVTSFIRQAEEKFNSDLRVDRMILTSQNIVTCGCASLPDDWIQSDFMLIASGSTPTSWKPIRYKPRDEFFRLPDTPYASAAVPNFNSTYGYYTVKGRTIYFGGPVNAIEGTAFQMSYYAEVPVFSDTVTSWVYTKYPSLYLYGSLMHADLHAVGEEDKASSLMNLTDGMIGKLNAAHLRSKASGSRLARARVRSFG
jgi:hypothetical protein